MPQQHHIEHHIREFAYQIWESEGKPDGQAERHWEIARQLAEAQTLGKQLLNDAAPNGAVKTTRTRKKASDATTELAAEAKPKATKKAAADKAEKPAKTAKAEKPVKAAKAEKPVKAASADDAEKPKKTKKAKTTADAQLTENASL